MTNYTLKKSAFTGWIAESIHEIGPSADPVGVRVLKLSTYKDSSGRIASIARASVIEDRGGYQVETTIVFQDYQKTVQRVEGRATEKNIVEAHKAALEVFPSFIDDAAAHYAAAK